MMVLKLIMFPIKNNIGMTESLVDDCGFPRNDIDVHQVRHARHQIICLQNDLKSLMKEIEKGIHQVHSEAVNETNADNSTKMAQITIDHQDETPLIPFVKVNLVTTGSPADDAVCHFYIYCNASINFLF